MADSPQLKEWFAMRRRAIHAKVQCHEILRRNGFSFKHSSDREEQFSCPFHGKDESPSARVYPSDAQSRSHVYCFVCKPSPSWDAIALWKKFSGEDKTHHVILTELERAFRIEVPAIPEGAHVPQGPTQNEQNLEKFKHLLNACEVRLIDSRAQYRQLNDLTGYLSAGSILDKASYQVSTGALSADDGITLLRKLLQKVGERIRSCPEP